ncbi:MAG TPA: hypothetical protein VL309_02490 [Vicinamibacterales bacterium]|jgi:hypothetical protein|nr:hypothetical protein [Vicinamibacterales bacterium]
MERRHFVKNTGLGLAGLYASRSSVELPLRPGSSPGGEASQARQAEPDRLKEQNNQIRREKFDIVLPEVMRKNHVDMWIHVMRETIPDPFGAEDLGSTSGLFVFIDRGGDRIERVVLERRWGASQAAGTWPVTWKTKLVEECGAYDRVDQAVLVNQPPGGPMTEYDYRFKGLRELADARQPKRIAVNYMDTLGVYPTNTKAEDGLSHTDYLLLTRELGPAHAATLVSSEFLMMDYLIRTVPAEMALLRQLRREEDDHIAKTFAAIVPGTTKNRDVGMTVFRRRDIGISQRGRTPGYENVAIQGGDIVAAPSQGTYAYVLRRGESEPPADIKAVWNKYLTVDRILSETIKAGLTPREIVRAYTPKFEQEGFVLRDVQLQLFDPPENFPAFAAGFDPAKTHLCIDCHGMGKGARPRKFENYLGPRIGSNGPAWAWDIPLPVNHHCVLEFFVYMPWRSTEYKDQYLFWWDHEQALVTERGVEHLSPVEKKLTLIK